MAVDERESEEKGGETEGEHNRNYMKFIRLDNI